MKMAHNGEARRIMVLAIMGHPHIMSPSVTPAHDMNECVDFLFIIFLLSCVDRCVSGLSYMTPYVQLATYVHD
jgi:hypothetical protein